MELKISQDKYTLQVENVLKNKPGHLYTITFTDISPKSDVIATGSWDGSVRLYSESEELEVIYFFKEPVEGLKFSPNGKFLAVGIENEIHIYDMASKKSFQVLPKENAIRGAVFAWSSDSSKLACVLFDHSIRVYDVLNKQEIGLIDDIPTLGGTFVSWKEDIFAVGLNNGNIAIYNLNSSVFQLVGLLEGHSDSVNGVIFSNNEDDLILYSVSNDNTLRSWDLKKNFKSKIVYTFDSRLISVSIKHTMTGQILIACSEKDTLVFIEEHFQFKTHLENVSYCNVSINSKADKFIRGIDDHDLAIYSINDERLISKLDGKDDYINAAVVLNGKDLYYASHDKLLHIIDLPTAKETILKGHKESISSLDVSHNRQLLVSSSYDDTVILWDLAKNEIIRTVTENAELPNCVLFNTDDSIVYCASGGDFSVRGYSLTGKKLFSQSVHEEYVNKFIPYKNGFFSIGDDKNIVYWENNKGRILVKSDSEIISCAISSNKDILAFGTEKGTLTFVEINTGKKKMEIKLNNSINCCAFSPDDNLLAIGSHTSIDIYDIVNNDLTTIFTFLEPTKEIFWSTYKDEQDVLSRILALSVSREVISCKLYLTEQFMTKLEKAKELILPKQQLVEIKQPVSEKITEPMSTPLETLKPVLDNNLKEKIVEEVKFIVDSEKEFQNISDFSSNLTKSMSSLELGSLVYKEYLETLKHLDKIQELIQINSDVSHEGFKVILNRINRLKPVINEALEEIDFILD